MVIGSRRLVDEQERNAVEGRRRFCEFFGIAQKLIDLLRIETERFGVGALPRSLEEALAELARDEDVRGWLSPLLYDAYVSLKRAELAAVAELDLAERCQRYAAAY